ncbi:glucosamine-6-phosphate deaminase [Schleiferilactobacillus harbinensis]|jgi:glucosamine-6-phosphate deaminase|uniref:Glucosamine-6-phosphate deaminase n=2 Tax=Schleiferilactobacillus harbinensis TaxID=304207 RepID=A0A510TVH3_9LACO|nr:glucosamine-6-phosphate deaminase [Schleiferilactobacillus harbinensis]KRM25585.1 glucosamine-6-phosphate isomerase [Schleiferilactobacillus harbinensis DSM 16991]MCI1688255.1 glucosamine-6-phosphate deaminase [Schleiferilactobacillus harbinensis]MCI1784225.1 glucosamine-6-phosphate deaminase [Schleiferilactobacillus harbinensis]MCI1849513.1 glucosamine-6-phosphate deaminase [Schleiferilactobacillus harbinensis]MCT2909705.1 glucosamine-6-phosphate deaminase [Schleiferilactobacillus harbinen
MNIITVKDAQEGGQKAFNIFKEALADNAKVFGLATGSTPITLYEALTASDLDFSDKTSINLDEYVGLAPDNPQSYHYFMQQHLFNKKPFATSYVPDGLATDADAETQRYDDIIAANPIDLQILGIGRNGHIGFNEPGSPLTGKTHKVPLTQSTIDANARFFENEEDVPRFAYSMGIGSIMTAKHILLMAYGENKADAIQKMVEGPVTNHVPASALQNHNNVTIIVDEAAASKLSK